MYFFLIFVVVSKFFIATCTCTTNQFFTIFYSTTERITVGKGLQEIKRSGGTTGSAITRVGR